LTPSTALVYNLYGGKNLDAQLSIAYRRPQDLIAAPYNPRTMDPRERKSLAKSIKRFGFVDPVVVNRRAGRA
jgi:ParB-like chromosome segregation protein Spo0J